MVFTYKGNRNYGDSCSRNYKKYFLKIRQSYPKNFLHGFSKTDDE